MMVAVDLTNKEISVLRVCISSAFDARNPVREYFTKEFEETAIKVDAKLKRVEEGPGI